MAPKFRSIRQIMATTPQIDNPEQPLPPPPPPPPPPPSEYEGRLEMYDFRTFFQQVAFSSEYFRDNIRSFIHQYGEPEDCTIPGRRRWKTCFFDGNNPDVVFSIVISEEIVMNSTHPFCDYCRSCGWSHHLITQRRYSLIVPMETADGSYDDDHENYALYCLIHCNGFGHLISVNGLERGSKIRGMEIMDLWNQVCTALRTRKITVEDKSRKGSMDLRLLYGVACNQFSWFERWSFKPFPGRLDEHQAAIESLSSLAIDQIDKDFNISGRSYKSIGATVLKYQEIATTRFNTIRDVMSSMFRLKDNPESIPTKVDVDHDIRDLYKQVLEDYPDPEMVNNIQVIRDNKHFVKEWQFNDKDDHWLRFICKVLPSPTSLETDPDQIVVLRQPPDIKDLINAVQSAFRDTYCVMRNYTVSGFTVVNENPELDQKLDQLLLGKLNSGQKLLVHGSSMDESSKLKYQGGVFHGTVTCSCGENYCNGERIAACDVCKAWKHTRCLDIKDEEPVLVLSSCSDCRATLSVEEDLLG